MRPFRPLPSPQNDLFRTTGKTNREGDENEEQSILLTVENQKVQAKKATPESGLESVEGPGTSGGIASSAAGLLDVKSTRMKASASTESRPSNQMDRGESDEVEKRDNNIGSIVNHAGDNELQTSDPILGRKVKEANFAKAKSYADSKVVPKIQAPQYDDEKDAPFSNKELAKYELPDWKTLNKLVDYYYIYNQPGHQILPCKSIFLKNISLNTDSSILHIFIGTICIIATRKDSTLKISPDEHYWIKKMYKYWDNLNGLGIMVCYKLIAKCTAVRFHMNKINQHNIKLYETIYDNNFVEVYSQKRFDEKESQRKLKLGLKLEPKSKLKLGNSSSRTSRQIYEREVVLKLMWSFYVYHIILLRFMQGRPYYKLSSIIDDFKFDYERDHYSNNVLLPLDDTDFQTLSLGANRTTWKQLHDKDHIPSDFNSLTLASKIFESLLSKLANGDLTFDNLISKNEFNVDLTNKIKNLHSTVVEDRKIIVVNVTYWLANMVLRVGEVLQYTYFIVRVMKFKLSKHDFRKRQLNDDDDEDNNNNSSNNNNHNNNNNNGNSNDNDDEMNMSEADEMSQPLICDELLDLDDPTTLLKGFDVTHWKSLVEVIKSMSGFVALIELIPLAKYKDFSIVCGPTLFNAEDDEFRKLPSSSSLRDVMNTREWWEAPELKASVKQSWVKLPQYTLSFSTAFLSVACSLVFLTKFIKLSRNQETGKLVVEFLTTGETRDIEGVELEDDVIESLFDQNVMAQQVSSICEFTKYKLSFCDEDLMEITIKRMNKLTQYLDNLLHR